MWEERSREHWQHTAALLAQAYNLNRGDRRARAPAEFDPWTRIDARRSRARDVEGDIDRMTAEWVDSEPDDEEIASPAEAEA